MFVLQYRTRRAPLDSNGAELRCVRALTSLPLHLCALRRPSSSIPLGDRFLSKDGSMRHAYVVTESLYDGSLHSALKRQPHLVQQSQVVSDGVLCQLCGGFALEVSNSKLYQL